MTVYLEHEVLRLVGLINIPSLQATRCHETDSIHTAASHGK